MMLVHIIADYGQGDLAFAEVVQRIKFYLPDAEPLLTPVPPFSTLAAGFCIAQLGLNEAPAGTIIYHNVAPREDDPKARTANAGERLAFARLKTGVQVIGVNAGHAYSFVWEEAEELRWASVLAKGSQFRSRDLFPQAAASIALGRSGALAGKIRRPDIPLPPKNRIAYIDGYGNLKITREEEEAGFPAGSLLDVKINGNRQEAIAAQGSFEVADRQMAFAPGSSGWMGKKGQKRRWMELFLRGGSAWEAFGRPPVGARIDFSVRSRLRKP
jgi:S-adenosylmethionine hydrolase